MKTEISRSLRNILTIAHRELFAFFVSPVAYAVIAFQFAACAYIMFLISKAAERPFPIYEQDPMGGGLTGAAPGIFFWIRFTAMLTFPLLTMRLLAEEQRTGTIEQLLTSPVRDIDVVLGKYLGALGLLLVTVVLSMVHLWWFRKYAQQEWPQMLAGLLGYIVLGATFLAVGLFVSSLTKSQIAAYVGTLGVLFLLWMIGWTAERVEGSGIAEMLSYVSLDDHWDDFLKGLLDARAFAYFGSLIGLTLFCTTRSIASHRAQ